jgi:drug/metabolite transporter superfamily protein YnfA
VHSPCSTPTGAWWANRRTRWRVIVLVIILTVFGWLIEAEQLTALEALGTMVVLSVVAGMFIDRVVDGGRLDAGGLATAMRLFWPAGGPLGNEPSAAGGW